MMAPGVGQLVERLKCSTYKPADLLVTGTGGFQVSDVRKKQISTSCKGKSTVRKKLSFKQIRKNLKPYMNLPL
jgi:hypothetical protein